MRASRHLWNGDFKWKKEFGGIQRRLYFQRRECCKYASRIHSQNSAKKRINKSFFQPNCLLGQSFPFIQRKIRNFIVAFPKRFSLKTREIFQKFAANNVGMKIETFYNKKYLMLVAQVCNISNISAYKTTYSADTILNESTLAVEIPLELYWQWTGRNFYKYKVN